MLVQNQQAISSTILLCQGATVLKNGALTYQPINECPGEPGL